MWHWFWLKVPRHVLHSQAQTVWIIPVIYKCVVQEFLVDVCVLGGGGGGGGAWLSEQLGTNLWHTLYA